MNRIILVLCMAMITPLIAHTHPTRSGHRSQYFENQYVRIRLAPGWGVAPPSENQEKKRVGDCCIVSITHGKYVLAINPVFNHASGGMGGRIDEILGDQPSIRAVTGGEDDIMEYLNNCVDSRSSRVSKIVALRSLYLDPTKMRANCCPISPASKPVWVASLEGGEGPESDYSIALTYNSDKLSSLPHTGSPELKRALSDVTWMLRTLHLKPPIEVSRIIPAGAPPGSTVTIYGRGFNLTDRPTVFFSEYPNNFMANPKIAADGRSMTFQIPDSIQTISCPPGRHDVHEWCVAKASGENDDYDCPALPSRRSNVCGVPMPPGSYHIAIRADPIFTDPIPFTVTRRPSAAVAIRLLYPNSVVSSGETITVLGRGFTPTGNTAQVGSVVVSNLESPDGTTITFPAPPPAGTSLVAGLHYYEAWVSNANGRSNAIIFTYR